MQTSGLYVLHHFIAASVYADFRSPITNPLFVPIILHPQLGIAVQRHAFTIFATMQNIGAANVCNLLCAKSSLLLCELLLVPNTAVSKVLAHRILKENCGIILFKNNM